MHVVFVVRLVFCLVDWSDLLDYFFYLVQDVLLLLLFQSAALLLGEGVSGRMWRPGGRGKGSIEEIGGLLGVGGSRNQLIGGGVVLALDLHP